MAVVLSRMLATAAFAAVSGSTGKAMTIDELRALLARHFASYRIKHKEQFAKLGPRPEVELETLEKLISLYDRNELVAGWNRGNFEEYLADREMPVAKGSPEYDTLLAEHARETIEYRRFVVAHDRQGVPEYASAATTLSIPTKGTRAPSISVLAGEYSSFNTKQGLWTTSTAKERENSFRLLTELLGDRPSGEVTSDDARLVRNTLLDMPSNRNKKLATKGLDIGQQLSAANAPKMQPRTIKKHLQTFYSLFEWATRERRIESNPFAGITVAINPRVVEDTARLPFSDDQLARIVRAITPTNGRAVNKDYQRWGPLIGMFSGARLNEICQLEVKDVRQVDGIWCFDLNDEGDSKSLKTSSARRLVPVHSYLIDLGLLEYVESVRSSGKTRLFDELSFDPKNKWGRALSRWFNEKLLVRLEIKNKQLTFHSLRHTMVNRLLNAGVEEAIVKAVVGHKSDNVTQQTYNRAG